MSRPQILIIGSTNTDLVIETPSLPAPGETVLGGMFRTSPGGKGANQAVAAARAGGEVTFITALGDDNYGKESRRIFTREGIDIRYLVTKPGMPSGVALILVDRQGENLIAVAPGANGELLPEDIAAADAAFTGARMLIMQLEIPLPSVEWAAQRAAAANIPVLLNPAPMPADGLSDDLLTVVDILTPNERELFMLAKGAATLEEAADNVLARGPKMLVVTRGRHGVAIFTREGSFSLPALPVDTVDTVGAGDCFSATMGVALAEGHSLPDAARFAIAAAGLSTTARGAQAGMPTRMSIEAALTGMME